MNLLYWFESIRTPAVTAVLEKITYCGGELVLLAVGIIVFWCISKPCGYYVLSMGFLGTTINQFVKILCRVPRPWVQDPNFTIVESARADAGGYSFPSGHTQNVFAAFGAPARYLKKAAVVIPCTIIILLTALSRMYLGVHTPYDVGFSILLGLILLIYSVAVKFRKGAPDGYTTNWGSSQGSVPTVCFAKWYDTEAPQWFKDRLRLRSTYVVEGVCDVQEYMEYLYQHPELINIALVLIVGYFKAFSSEQLGGYKAGDFVPEWYNEAKYEVNGRKLSYLDAVSHYIPDILHIHSTKMTSFTEVFAPDILTADGKVDLNCPKLRAWMSCHAKHCDLNNWTPVHPVYIAHSKADEMIPFEMAYSLYRRISNNGQNPMVHMLSVPSMHYVPRGGMNPHFVLAFMGQIMMAFAENPEGMQRLYKTVK